MITIGAIAPDFTLPGTDGTEAGHRDYSLSDYVGQPVDLDPLLALASAQSTYLSPSIETCPFNKPLSHSLLPS